MEITKEFTDNLSLNHIIHLIKGINKITHSIKDDPETKVFLDLVMNDLETKRVQLSPIK
jgi:hypothetical protein